MNLNIGCKKVLVIIQDFLINNLKLFSIEKTIYGEDWILIKIWILKIIGRLIINKVNKLNKILNNKTSIQNILLIW